jgi:hypothetical protein
VCAVVNPVCKAAFLLNASVTFLSLLGLPGVARVVAFFVVLLSVGVMASGLVALFQYNGEIVDAAVQLLNPDGRKDDVPLSAFLFMFF